MGSSNKKLYHRPVGLSVRDHLRQHAVFTKEILSKFSEFEKPYVDGGYPEMQSMPNQWPDWPQWKFPPFPPFNPNIPSGPPPSIWSPPDPKIDPEFWPGCHWVEGLPGELGEGEIYPLTVWAEAFRKGVSDISFGEPITSFNYAGSASVTLDPIPGYFVGGHAVILEGDGEAGDLVEVIATTATGRTCQTAGALESVCAATTTITYTSLTMTVGTDQTLEASDGQAGYTWTSTGGGSISSSSGASITYTAAASNNDTCDNNGEINLLCDGVIIDTIIIAANDYEGAADGVILNAYYLCWCCTGAEVCPGQGACGAICRSCNHHVSYDCDGTTFSDYTNWGTCIEAPPPCSSWNSDCSSIPESWTDNRDAGQKSGGCCPIQYTYV